MRYFMIQYLRQADGRIEEQVLFSKRTKDADLQAMNVIMDYRDKKVIKCVIESKVIDTSFEKLHEYYYQVYPTLIDQIIQIQAIVAKGEE